MHSITTRSKVLAVSFLGTGRMYLRRCDGFYTVQRPGLKARDFVTIEEAFSFFREQSQEAA